MKKRLNLTTRLACAALAAGILCFTGLPFAQAQEEDTAASAPAEEGLPNEKAFNTMAGVGAKPSKAELAKMEAEKAAKAPAKAGNAPAKPGNAKMAALAPEDQAFLIDAGKGGMMEVEMGKMAAKQGKSAGVKEVGNMLVADHTKANNELMGLAQQKGVKLQKPNKMAKMSSDNFDSMFLTQAMQHHQKDIAMFERAAKNCKDREVKAWAKKTLPTLKKHLKAVKKAQGSMGTAS